MTNDLKARIDWGSAKLTVAGQMAILDLNNIRKELYK